MRNDRTAERSSVVSMAPKKMVLIVCDGLPTGRSGVGLKTPSGRKEAGDGRVGEERRQRTMDVIGPGIIPGSDTAHLALFGYDPRKVYTGRGPIEAVGVGLRMQKGDVAFRCNFATVDRSMRSGIVVRAGIKTGNDALAKSISKHELEVALSPCSGGFGARGALVLRAQGLIP